MTEIIDKVAPSDRVERVDDDRYERFTYSKRYSDEIVKLSQVRAEQNIVKGELVVDIRRNGLINPIDVGVISEALLVEYLQFVKNTWGAAAELEDFENLRQPDGSYTLLLAGHSRHQAIEDIEEQECLETGVMVRAAIPVKEHAIGSIWDIIRIQLGENIHSQPPKERQAIALVEAYEYGNWNSVDEFLESGAGKDVTKGFMEKAIRFRELPPEIRSYVLSGPVPYYAGVELALTVEPLKKFYAAKIGKSLDKIEHENDGMDILVRQELTILCNRIIESRMNSTAAQTHVKSWRKHWNDATKKLLDEPSAQNTLDFELESEDIDKFIKAKEAEISRQLASMARLKHSDVVTLIRLADGAVGREKVNALLEKQTSDAEKAVEKGRSLLGKKAHQAMQIEDLFEAI
jgi:hypothetical protein